MHNSERGFTQVPNEIIMDERISIQARMLYILLLSRAWTTNQVFPGQKYLGERMGISDRSVRKYLSELVEFGLLSSERRGLTKTNIYTLHKWRSSGLEEKKFPFKNERELPSQNGGQLPIKNNKKNKTKSERVTTTPAFDSSVDEKALSIPEIVEVCEPHLQNVSLTTGVTTWDIREVLTKMAAYYSAEGRTFKNWPAKLTEWVMKDLQDGKLEKDMFVLEKAQEEATKKKYTKIIISLFGDKWRDIPGLVKKLNEFLSANGGIRTPQPKFIAFLEDLKKDGISTELQNGA